MENMYRKFYYEITIAMGAIKVLSSVIEENSEMPLELKNDVSDTLSILKESAEYCKNEILNEVMYSENINHYYNTLNQTE